MVLKCRQTKRTLKAREAFMNSTFWFNMMDVNLEARLFAAALRICGPLVLACTFVDTAFEQSRQLSEQKMNVEPQTLHVSAPVAVKAQTSPHLLCLFSQTTFTSRPPCSGNLCAKRSPAAKRSFKMRRKAAPVWLISCHVSQSNSAVAAHLSVWLPLVLEADMALFMSCWLKTNSWSDSETIQTVHFTDRALLREAAFIRGKTKQVGIIKNLLSLFSSQTKRQQGSYGIYHVTRNSWAIGFICLSWNDGFEKQKNSWDLCCMWEGLSHCCIRQLFSSKNRICFIIIQQLWGEEQEALTLRQNKVCQNNVRRSLFLSGFYSQHLVCPFSWPPAPSWWRPAADLLCIPCRARLRSPWFPDWCCSDGTLGPAWPSPRLNKGELK